MIASFLFFYSWEDYEYWAPLSFILLTDLVVCILAVRAAKRTGMEGEYTPNPITGGVLFSLALVAYGLAFRHFFEYWWLGEYNRSCAAAGVLSIPVGVLGLWHMFAGLAKTFKVSGRVVAFGAAVLIINLTWSGWYILAHSY